MKVLDFNLYKKKYRKQNNKFIKQSRKYSLIKLLPIVIFATCTGLYTQVIKVETIIFLWVLYIAAILMKYYVVDKENKKYLNMTQEQVDILSGKNFEKYLKPHFEKLGYNVMLTPDTNDYGADLILSNDTEKVAVQAKRYKGKVGNSAVQEVVGAMHYYKCDRAIVVTNSFFTPNAVNLADRCNVELWDRNILKKKFNIKNQRIRE